MRRGHGTLGFLSKSGEFDGKKKTCAFARCKKLQKNAQEYEKKGNKGQGIDDRVSEGVVCAPPTTTPSIMHDYQREKIHGMSNLRMPPSKGHVFAVWEEQAPKN